MLAYFFLFRQAPWNVHILKFSRQITESYNKRNTVEHPVCTISELIWVSRRSRVGRGVGCGWIRSTAKSMLIRAPRVRVGCSLTRTHRHAHANAHTYAWKFMSTCARTGLQGMCARNARNEAGPRRRNYSCICRNGQITFMAGWTSRVRPTKPTHTHA